MSTPTATRNLGDRTNNFVRAKPEIQEAIILAARTIGVPANTIWVFAGALLLAQFAPVLADKGLNLDQLEEAVRELFADARRVVETRRKSRPK